MIVDRSILLAAALAALGATPALAQKKAPEGAKVLLLSGGQREHHGYREQAMYLAGLLEDTRRYQVTIAEDAAVLEPANLSKYDIVLMTADRRDPEHKLTEAQQRALLEHVKSGHGFVAIHGADNAAPDWLPEFKAMLGGVFSHQGLPDGKVRKGNYAVKVVGGHPITEGTKDFVLVDELYYHMQMQPDVKPLATVDHDGVAWPVAWARTYGSGRVFHTPLGHRDFGPDKDDPLKDPNLARIVVKGVDWVAAGLLGRPRLGRAASAR